MVHPRGLNHISFVISAVTTTQCSNEKEKKEVDGMENDCRNCVSCEKCDYLKNSDNCKMCDKVFDDALDKYVDKGKQSTEGSALHRLLHNP